MGWALLSVLARVALVLGAVTTVVTAVVAAVDRAPWRAVGALASGAGSALFFWWIHLGASLRVHPPDDDDRASAATGNGLGVHAPPVRREVGPWGWVGVGLTTVVLGALAALVAWASITTSRDRTQVERVRDAAVAQARTRHLTVEDLRVASTRRYTDPESTSDLLRVPGGRVLAVSADGDHGSILIRPDRGSPPCVVVDVLAGDVIRGRLTDNC